MPAPLPMTTFDLHVESPPQTSNPNHRLRPSQVKTNREAQITFDKTLKGHYRHGKTGYNKVGALFLTWENDDMQCKATEVDALNAFFKERFHFETDHYEIPSTKWQTSLNKKISEFIWEYDSPDCLVLIYYGGHAYEGTETGSLKLAGKQEADGDGDPTYFWNDISNCLRLPACDQLVITDCCFAARTFGPEHVGKGKFELLTSAGPDQRVPSPKMPHSFTKSLHEVLAGLLEKNPQGFPTSRLYREIYHRWTFAGAKPFLFDQSRYSHDKIWLRPQEKLVARKDSSQGSGDSLLKLTLRLNGEPGNVMMNQLAMALQYLPNVDEVRFDKLYAPKDQIEDFMFEVYRATKLRPLVRKLHAKLRLKKLKAIAPALNPIGSHSKFVNLLLDHKTRSPYDWSSATTDKKSDPSFIHHDRRRSFTWPTNRGVQRGDKKSFSNRLFSIDYKLSIPDRNSLISRILPRPVKIIDLTNSVFLSFASLPNNTYQAQRNHWKIYVSREETWHIFMWLAMMYVYGSMYLYMVE